MILDIISVSDVGIIRTNNEDMLFDGARFIRDDKHSFKLELNLAETKIMFAIADGMGGHNAGELASDILLHEIINSFSAFTRENIYINDSEIKSFFDSEIKRIHKQLVDEGISDLSKKGMGSTFVALVIYKSKFYAINAGDSRLYRFRDGILKQITKDHSYASIFGEERASSHLIYNAVGGGDKVFIDFTDITSKIDDDDVLLLCSDGLSDMLDDEDIEELMDKTGDIIDLIRGAKDAGGKDNISIIKIKIELD
ncbi:MAG: protein phosphatase 2C domain-containing protein [bacterium]